MPPVEEEGAEEAPMAEDLDFGTDLMKLFDFDEGSLKDKVSEIISSNFKGTIDDVGFQRIVSDATGNEMTISKLDIDEYTSPGEIIYVVDRLFEEIKNVRRQPPESLGIKNEYMNELQKLRASLEQEGFTEKDSTSLVKLYDNVFRLNRYVVHREAVTLDPESKGYWRWFDPYFQ